MSTLANTSAQRPAAARQRCWVPVRTLGRRHARRVAEHLLALDPEDRALRFGVAASDDRIRQYVDQIDFDADEVLGIFDRRLRLVAMAHLAFGAGGRGSGGSAEFGVSVLAEQRGKGLGSRLFEQAAMHARNRGVREMVIHLARENTGMLGIVRRAGAELHFDGADAVARLPLAADTLGSQLGELIEQHAAAWDYRLKLQTLRL